MSIDTLDGDKFRDITRWGRSGQVCLPGIEGRARTAGLSVKLNAVALKGVNDTPKYDGPDPLRARPGLRSSPLIETMPMGDIEGGPDRPATCRCRWCRADLARQLDDGATSPIKTGGPARYVEVAETGGKIGFITPMTHNFCESCNRVRLTCTGTLFMCLGQDDAADLRAPLRASEGNELLATAIDEAIGRKPKGHDFVIDRRTRRPSVSRHMSVTGG